MTTAPAVRLALPQLFRVGLELRTKGFQVGLALAGVGVQLSQVLAELFARMGQGFNGMLSPLLQLRQLPLQQQNFLARGFDLGLALSAHLGLHALRIVHTRPIGAEQLALRREGLANVFQAFVSLLQRRLTVR